MQHGAPGLGCPGASPLIVYGDQNGHEWQITVLDGGAPADLTGASILAYFARADGKTVLQPGEISGNVVTIDFSAACCAVVGRIGVSVRMSQGDQRLTLAQRAFAVKRAATDDMIDPSGVVPTPEEMKEIIERAEAAAQAIEGLTVEAAQSEDGTLSATVSDVNGHKHIAFTFPQGAPGSDASVTAENIKSALGYTPVKDVRLNGESLVQNSAATIPLAGYNRLGAVQLDPAGFAAASVEGKLALVPPTDAQISTHTYTQRPITPSCMDYAVTAAMTDGKGPAWTAAQQTAARERMGIPGDYELIEEITISEAVTSFIRESTPDGTPYSLAGFFCVITSPGVDKAIVLNQTIFAGETSLYNYGVRAVDAAVNSKSVLFARVNNKILHGEQYPVGTKYEFANVPRFAKKFVPDGSPITKIIFSGPIPANIKITIYGVRAQ